MAQYLMQVAYTADAAKAMLDHLESREEAARKAVESLGGKLNSFHFAFGEYDAVLIVKLPNNVSAAALALATASSGAFSKLHTTVLMTAAEGLDAMKAAKEVVYSAPR